MPKKRRRSRRSSTKKLSGYALHLYLYPRQKLLLPLFLVLSTIMAWATPRYQLGELGYFCTSILVAIFCILFIQFRKTRCFLHSYKTITQLRQMDPYEFEIYIVNLLKRLGYRAHGTGKTGDLGADFIASKNWRTYLGQVKRYQAKKNIGSELMQQFVGSMQIYGKKHGLFITTSAFTRDAKKIAENHNIQLVDASELSEWIFQAQC